MNLVTTVLVLSTSHTIPSTQVLFHVNTHAACCPPDLCMCSYLPLCLRFVIALSDCNICLDVWAEQNQNQKLQSLTPKSFNLTRRSMASRSRHQREQCLYSPNTLLMFQCHGGSLLSVLPKEVRTRYDNMQQIRYVSVNFYKCCIIPSYSLVSF